MIISRRRFLAAGATGALAFAHAQAARDALVALPDSDYRDALATLADYSVQRTF